MADGGHPIFKLRREFQEFFRISEHLMASIIDPSNPPIAEDERALVAYYLAEIGRHIHLQPEDMPKPNGIEKRNGRIKSREVEKWAKFHTQSLQLLDAAIEIDGASKGNVQLCDPDIGALEIVVHRGFKSEFLKCFQTVRIDDDCACGRAFRSRKRVFISDIRADIAFGPYVPVADAAGFRAVQSTPIIGSNGSVLGMLSTHFSSVPSLSKNAEFALDDIASSLGHLIINLVEELEPLP